MGPAWNPSRSRRWSILLTFEKLTQLHCRSFAPPGEQPLPDFFPESAARKLTGATGSPLYPQDQTSSAGPIRFEKCQILEVATHAELTSKSGSPRCLPLGAVLPAWCDQISTPAKNQLYPYSGHSCAHRHPHDFGKLFIAGR